MNELEHLLQVEEDFTKIIEQSDHWTDRDTIRHDKVEYLKDLGKSGDIDNILNAERDMLKFTLEMKLNHENQRNSIETALVELNQTFKMLERVRDPDRYKETNEVHALKSKRTNGHSLPKDDARHFFDSHSARFTNMNKSEMTATEKLVIDVRQKNVRTAKDIYTALQRNALGIQQPKQEKAADFER